MAKQTQYTIRDEPNQYENLPDFAQKYTKGYLDDSERFRGFAGELYRDSVENGSVAGLSDFEKKAYEMAGWLPGWYQGLEQSGANMLGSAQQAYGQAYQSALPFQQSANRMWGKAEDEYGRALGKGEWYGDQAGRLLMDPNAMREGFEDPYLDAITDQIVREADRNRLKDESRMAAAGGLTGSRAAVGDMLREEMTTRERNKAASDAFRFATDAGFQRVGGLQSQANDTFGRGFQAAQGYGDLGQQYQGAGNDVFGRGMQVGQGYAGLGGQYEDMATGRYNRGSNYMGMLGAMGEQERAYRQSLIDEPWSNLGRYGSMSGLPTSFNDSLGLGGGGRTEEFSRTKGGGGGGGGWANILGGVGAAAGIAAKVAPFFMASDVRLKEDVKHVGETEDGTRLYSFHYIPEFVKDDPQYEGEFVGPMAQDLLETRPDVVGTIPWRGEDYLAINFARL